MPFPNVEMSKQMRAQAERIGFPNEVPADG
jgi:hypothetical protein